MGEWITDAGEVIERTGGGGRPTKYAPEFVRIAEVMCRLGATDLELADEFDCSLATLWHWRARYPEFAEATKIGKEEADERVGRSLYHRAVGYTYDSEKIFKSVVGPEDCKSVEVTRVPYREHVPPDPTSCMYWLNNRQPGRWRNRQEVTGLDGGPVELRVISTEMSVREAADAYLDTLKTIDGEFTVVAPDKQQQIPPPAAKPAAKKKRAKKG